MGRADIKTLPCEVSGLEEHFTANYKSHHHNNNNTNYGSRERDNGCITSQKHKNMGRADIKTLPCEVSGLEEHFTANYKSHYHNNNNTNYGSRERDNGYNKGDWNQRGFNSTQPSSRLNRHCNYGPKQKPQDGMEYRQYQNSYRCEWARNSDNVPRHYPSGRATNPYERYNDDEGRYQMF